jgi:V/A-type H+-transporting ATPase subunit I
MIVAMKKVFLLIQHANGPAALERLRQLGVVHVEHESVPSGQELSELNEKLNLIEQARSVLSGADQKHRSQLAAHKPEDWIIICRHVIDLAKRYGQLKEYAVSLRLGIDFWKHWGDFDPGQIKSLQQKNVQIKFYQIPKEKIKSLPPEILFQEISRQGQLLNCLSVSIGNIDLGFKEIELPKLSLSQMKHRLEEDASVMQDIREEIARHLVFEKELVAAEERFLDQKDFYTVLKGMGQAGEFIYLKGYIPVDAEAMLIQQAKICGWGILTLKPSPDDAVPTLVRNPAWVKLIQPLLKLLEIVPGYKELDISPLFLIFFSLFFGMIIGDAGYGLLYFVITFVVDKKVGKKMKDKNPIFLFYVLSSCAIIWGIISGTFFGQAWLVKLGIKPLVPSLSDISFVQAFCFLIGAIHLTIAHSWRMSLKLPALIALADLGWISIIWAAFFLAKNLLLGDQFPFFGRWLIWTGISLVILFTNPQRNVLKGIGEGVAAIALGLVNNFTDVISYVRLFAVGLAGVAIADAFNMMAAGNSGAKGLGELIAGLLILIAGHTLNFILGPMSVLVHGVRLNVLEFCSHANVSWSGFEYKPFSKKGK